MKNKIRETLTIDEIVKIPNTEFPLSEKVLCCLLKSTLPNS